jgi:hypothetical protein
VQSQDRDQLKDHPSQQLGCDCSGSVNCEMLQRDGGWVKNSDLDATWTSTARDIRLQYEA